MAAMPSFLSRVMCSFQMMVWGKINMMISDTELNAAVARSATLPLGVQWPFVNGSQKCTRGLQISWARANVIR